jgi:hypothetical protein
VFHENEKGAIVHVVETPCDHLAVVVHERDGENIHLNEGTGGRGAEVVHVNEKGCVIHITEPPHETATATATASPGPNPTVSPTATAASTAE